MDSIEDETSLITSLNLYREQLEQVEAGLQSSDSGAVQDDLRQLQNDLKEIIHLTEEALANHRIRKSEDENATAGNFSQQNGNQSSSFSYSKSDDNLNAAGVNLDSEYAAFQILLGDHITQREKHKGVMIGNDDNEDSVQNDNNEDDDEEDDEEEDDEDEETDGGSSSKDSDAEEEEDLFGQKCQAPFSCSWGQLGFHNAIILSRVKNDCSDDEAMVEVLFCNPTHVSMRPCPYYLSGNCRFDAKTCRYSHGEQVKVSDLRPFLEPDFSNLALGTRCLGRDDDDIWYEATVVEILEDAHFQIQFAANDHLKTVPIKDLYPLACQPEDDEIDASVDDDRRNDGSPQETERPFQLKTTEAIGQWEMHTKGIGSKLMAKMGYMVGQGLGRNNEGRAEPVPINLIPKGISLDKIMELKSIAQNEDLFNALKKVKRKHKLNKHNTKSDALRDRKTNSPSVFNFINNKLCKPKGHSRTSMKCHTLHMAKETKFISAAELKDKSDKHLNIQLLKTNEEIKNTQKQILRLKDSLERACERGDHSVSKEIRRKLDSLNAYTSQLKTSEAFIKNQKKTRKAHDTLTKF